VTTQRYMCSCFNWKLSIPLPYFVFVCCAVVICLLLSRWQWQRAESAAIRYEQYQAQVSQLAIALSPSPQQYQKVAITGEIKNLLLLDNQIYQGSVGWHVLATVQTQQGNILVNLGWQSKRSPLIKQSELANPIEIQGILKKPQSGFMLQAANKDPNWPQVLQQIQIPLLIEHYGYKLLPFVLYADAPVANLVPAPVATDNKYYMHLGYAIQWLLIAGICVIGFIYFCRQEHKQNESS
jgi:surfeit locus 1 family protein